MSWDALRWALSIAAPSSASKLLLIIMANLDRPPAHRIFAKAHTLADLAQMDRKTVLANLKRLEEAGLITRLPERTQRGGAPVFVLNIDPNAISETAESDTENGTTSTATTPAKVIPDFPGSEPKTGTTSQSASTSEVIPVFPRSDTSFPTEVIPKTDCHTKHRDEPVRTKREQRSAPKLRIPDDWQPDQVLKAWAAEERPDLDLAIVAEKFRDYWLSQGTARASWEASFRNWVRKERASGVNGLRKSRHSGFEQQDYSAGLGPNGELL